MDSYSNAEEEASSHTKLLEGRPLQNFPTPKVGKTAIYKDHSTKNQLSCVFSPQREASKAWYPVWSYNGFEKVSEKMQQQIYVPKNNLLINFLWMHFVSRKNFPNQHDLFFTHHELFTQNRCFCTIQEMIFNYIWHKWLKI